MFYVHHMQIFMHDSSKSCASSKYSVGFKKWTPRSGRDSEGFRIWEFNLAPSCGQVNKGWDLKSGHPEAAGTVRDLHDSNIFRSGAKMAKDGAKMVQD